MSRLYRANVRVRQEESFPLALAPTDGDRLFLGSSESLLQEGNRSGTEEHLSYEVVRLRHMIS